MISSNLSPLPTKCWIVATDRDPLYYVKRCTSDGTRNLFCQVDAKLFSAKRHSHDNCGIPI